MARSVARGPRRANAPATQEAPVTLTLTGMAPTGEAIGRLEGMVVFVPYALPGERVRVRLVQRKRTFARGALVEVLEPAPARVLPRCPLFGRCGGCDWQHVSADAQLAFKTGIVREQLARIGGLDGVDVRPCAPSPASYGYRNHARLVLDAQGRTGFRAAGAHAIVPVDDCPILEPALREALADLPATVTAEGTWQPGDELEVRAWDEQIQVGESAYLTSPGVFFQANTAVAAQIVNAVVQAAAYKGDMKVLDLYCGVGLFTVPLGRRAAAVTGVEANRQAAADARANLAAAGIDGLIVAQDVAAALAEKPIAGEEWDVVVLDPPRTGVAAEALHLLAELRSPRIVYVSCEPATLARDVRSLCAQGYALSYVQPFDMFPQTRHVECVAVFIMDAQ